MKYRNLLLALSAGVLLSLSWYYNLSAFIFCAFVPLLLLEKYFSENRVIPRRKLKMYGLVYIAFLIWNIGVTWWVYCVQFGKEGALMAFFANALLMTVVFITFSNIKNKVDASWGVWLLVPVWLAWEHLHTLWDLSWSWLNVGNVFSYHPNWVQWYEFTGASGGTIWVLIVNIMLFNFFSQPNFSYKRLITPLACIALPIGVSYYLLYSFKNNSGLKKCNMIIVQPNIDPYNEKFNSDFSIQFNKMLKQVRGKINEQTDFLVLPETFVSDDINEEQILQEESIQLFKDSLLTKYPGLNIVTGINSYRFYRHGQQKSHTARLDKSSGLYYDYFNSAALLNIKGAQVYHKSKLVPGVELMPFPWLFKPFESLAIELGGTSGSLGTQETRDALEGGNGIKVAPVICYESIYGDYCTGYIRNGAHFIFIVTNDGWWDNTPGHKQHLNYARLRAIENRRCIIRSANTGISAFIDETGNIHQPTKWWEEAVITDSMSPNSQLTFFSRSGDILSKLAVAVAIISLMYYWFLRFLKR